MLSSRFHPAIGGAELQAQRLSKALISRRWVVNVLTRQHGYTLPNKLPLHDMVDGVPVSRICSLGRGKTGAFLYVIGALRQLLRKGRGDIYHAHGLGAPSWVAVIARHLFGGRCLIKLRSGRLVYEQICASEAYRWQFDTLLRLADRIIVVNREVEEFVHDRAIPPTKSVRIPNAIDTGFFRPIAHGFGSSVRAQLGLPVDGAVFLYVGRLDYLKGVDVLIRAWSLLPDGVRHKAVLVVVGDGSERETLLRMIDSLGLRESVLMRGMQRDVREYYWAADVFVLPSRTEGLSNAMLEAMACGLPSVCTSVGGTPDWVRHGDNGMLCSPEDPVELQCTLVDMLNNQTEWEAMGLYSRNLAERELSWGKMLSDIESLYRGLG